MRIIFQAIRQYVFMGLILLPIYQLPAESYSPVIAATAIEIEGISDSQTPPFNYLAPSVYPFIEFHGSISDIGVDYIADEDSRLAENEFVPNEETGGYYVRFISGANEGLTIPIKQNDDQGRFYFDINPADMADLGDRFVIEHHPSLIGAFGKDNLFSGLNSGDSFESSDAIMFLDNLGNLSTFYHFYFSESSSFWISDESLVSGTYQLEPGKGFVIRKRTSEKSVLYQLGLTRESAYYSGPSIHPGINLVGTGHIDRPLTLDQLGLIDTTSEGFKTGTSPANADSLTIPQNDGSLVSCFYLKTEQTEGWYTFDYQPVGELEIQPGQAFYINRLPGLASYLWEIPTTLDN